MPGPSRKRQTRLTFSPLPSSSPAAAKYPEQVQERAASVRYDASAHPSKKRRLGDGSSGRGLLSPASSSPASKIGKGLNVASAHGTAKPRGGNMIFSRPSLPTPTASSQIEDMEAFGESQQNQ